MVKNRKAPYDVVPTGRQRKQAARVLPLVSRDRQVTVATVLAVLSVVCSRATI